MPDRIPPDLWSLLTMLFLSAVSGVVSVTQRIASGRAASFVWIFSELLAAVLAGYLASEFYLFAPETFQAYIPITVFVSTCAYSGGRFMQVAERTLYSKLPGGRP